MSESAQRDVDAVLRRIPVLATYSANLFRIIGLPTDAGATAVRRRREDLGMSARLGAALPSPWGELAPDPTPDAEAIKAAFEALAAPLVRLVHEAFWFDGTGGTHDAAVGAHCRALDAEAKRETGTDELWAHALTNWSRTLESPEFWQRLDARAREIDDPRVTAAHVQGLRESVPRRVLAANALLAVNAATAGDDAGVRRHIDLLAASPFSKRAVLGALRDACAPVVDRLHDHCSAVLRAAADEPAEALATANRMLEFAPSALVVPTAVLPADDPLPAALHDEVASAVVRASVAFVNDGGDPADVTPLLAQARDLAREQTTVALVDRTADDLAEAAIRTVIQPWLTAGDPNGAVEVLRQWAKRIDDPELRTRLRAMAEDPRSVRAELVEVPTRSQFLGCGVRPYGRRAELDDTWIETRYITVFWVPVHSLAAYLSDEDYVYAKVPLSPLTRRLRFRGALRAGPGPGVRAARDLDRSGRGRRGDARARRRGAVPARRRQPLPGPGTERRGRARVGNDRGARTTELTDHQMRSSMSETDEVDAALADALTNLWRTARKLDAGQGAEATQQAARHLRTACDAFARAGLSFQDHDGVAFDPGMALEVIAVEPRPDVRSDVVLETVRPCVYSGQRRIQVGQVIVARPETRKDRKARS